MSKDLTGSKIAHYSISSKIGSGGMGEVYRARDERLGRDVALKVLPDDMANDPARLERFEREAKVVAALNHPNIVTIHSVEKAEGIRFLTMELVEGESLDRVLSKEGQALARIFDIATPLADALATAHERGIVHRDLKPANVMITREGRVKVLDFGLAKLTEEATAPDDVTSADTKQADVTDEGTVLGTLPYMSPEQVRGQTVDHRSDIFSLGVMLYELAMGTRPFGGGTSSDLISSILRDAPPIVDDERRDLPRHLGRIVSRCLEKDPERRYQSAKDVRNELELLRKEVDSGVSEVTSDAASSAYRAAASRPSNKLLRFGLPAAVVVVAIVAIAILRPFKGDVQVATHAVADDHSLAVMYFENVVDPSDPQRLGQIATRLLIADMSESQYVSVVSTQRLRDVRKQLGYEGSDQMDPDVATQVATKAGAKWMLMGTILRTEPTLLVTSELVDVASGKVAASQRIAGQAGEEIFDIVDRLTVEVKSDLALPTEAMNEPDRKVADMTSHSADAYRLFIEGVDLFHQVRTVEARQVLLEAVEIDSTLAPAWLRLGLTDFFPFRGRLRGDDIQKAMNHADDAGRLDRLYIEAFYASWQEDDATGVAKLEEAQRLFPNEKETYLFLGTLRAFRAKDFRGGIADLRQVVDLDPTYKIAWNYMAYAYFQVGDVKKSVEALNRYIEIVPEEANPYDTAGDIYAMQGDLQKAINMYRTALTKATSQAWTQRKLASLYLFTGRFDEARALSREILDTGDYIRRTNARYQLAWPSIRQGKYAEALVILERAIADTAAEEDPSNAYIPNARLARARILWELDRREQALEIMESIASGLGERRYTGTFEVYWAYMHAQNGNHERAREIAETMRRRLAGDNGHLMSYYPATLGVIAFAIGNNDEAVEHLERAVGGAELVGGGWEHLALARAYIEAGRLGEAVEMFEYSLDRTPNPGGVLIEGVQGYYYLGLAYERSGWQKKAIANYEKFLDIWKDADPGVPLIDDARQRLETLQAGS